MVTLTYASITARKSLRYFIYFIIFLIVGRITLSAVIGLYKKIFPPAPAAPTVAFGKLPKLPFKEVNKVNAQFVLETVDGELPSTPLVQKVYFMPKQSANLLSLDYAKQTAQKLGFDQNPEQISDSIYKFKNSKAPSTLETNIITGTFSISYDLNADPTPIMTKPTQPEVSIATVKNFLNSATLLAEDLTGESKFRYLKTQGGGFVPALSLSDANIIRIDLFRKNYSELPTVTNSPSDGNVWFMVSGVRDRGKDIIAGEYHYFVVDETKTATYPIKPVSQAWQELTNNSYNLISFTPSGENPTIKIRKIYLAYYDPGVYVEFFQPVFVFEGDNNFVAYIPAISQEYYSE